MATTLRDLAQLVGLDPSTVSRILSDDPAARVSEATRKRVFEKAEEIGYRANRLARSLKTRRSHILGIMVPNIIHPFFSGLFRGVEDVAGNAGYNVIGCSTDDSIGRFDQQLRMLSEGLVEGLLIATVHRAGTSPDWLRKRHVPYVLVNRRRDANDDPWVIGDDIGGTRLAVEHLVQLGHRRIAHLAGAQHTSTGADRLLGFRLAVESAGLDLDRCDVIQAGFSEAEGERAMHELLHRPVAERPTAIVAVNDLAAVGALRVAFDAGIRVPGELSIVGYDDLPIAGQGRPGLTTVRVPIYEMGTTAATLLLARLETPDETPAQPQQVTMPVELIVRDSTAPPAR